LIRLLRDIAFCFGLTLFCYPAYAIEDQLRKYSLDLIAVSKIPSVAITVVRSGAEPFSQVHGVVNVESNVLATPDTLYKVGSISKSITAAAIGILVSRRMVSLDAPIGQYLVELNKINRPLALVTVRKLLSHQTRIDLDRLEPLIWPQPNQFSFSDIASGLKVLAQRPRRAASFHYSNLNYVIAAEIVSRVGNTDFDQFLSREIFKPLAMNCNSGQFVQAQSQNFAQPHSLLSGKFSLVRADFQNTQVGLDASAGGIRCSIRAMQRWLEFQMDRSTSRLGIDDKTWRALHQPEVLVRVGNRKDNPTIRVDQYGFGLEFISDQLGVRIEHFGGVAGMRSYMAFYPKLQFGYAILLNSDSNAARALLAECISTLLFDWSASCEPLLKETDSVVKPDLATMAKPLSGKEKIQLSGVFHDAYFGRLSICERANELSVTVEKSKRFEGQVRSVGKNELGIFWNDRAIDSDSVIRSTAIRSNRVHSFTLKPIGQSDFDFSAMRFVRIANCPR
jgi:CubicO group peptidase (beta-lactamase class C family)